MNIATKQLYDVQVCLKKGFVEVRPLNESAKHWISVTILKPCGISRRLDFEYVNIPVNDLEKVLRKLMFSGFQVNFIR